MYMCSVMQTSDIQPSLHVKNSKIIKADIVNSAVTLWYSGSVAFLCVFNSEDSVFRLGTEDR